MLRNITKSIGLAKALINPSSASSLLKFNQIPVYHFGSQKPPKGFEKFQRKRRPSSPKEDKDEAEEPKPQKVEVEDESVKADKKQPETKHEDSSEKSEIEKLKERLRARREASKKEKEPEEERIEDEDEDAKEKGKKKQEDSQVENLKNLFGAGKQSKDGKDGKGPNEPKTPRFHPKYLLFAGVGGFLMYQAFMEYYHDHNHISYTDFFKNYIPNDSVSKIHIRRVSDNGTLKTVAYIKLQYGSERMMVIGNLDHFLEQLEKAQIERGITVDKFIPVEFEYRVEQNKAFDRLFNLLYLSLIISIVWILFKNMRQGMNQIKNMGGGQGGGPGDIFNMGKSQVKIYGIDNKIKTRFKDVAGQDEAKLEITEFVDFLKKPQRFRELGAKIPRGALLHGPPGTGKTLLAKAAAGEAGVPFLYISGSDFVEMFVGVGASRVRDLFKKAKEHAPSIIFIDEIDAVGRKRENKVGGSDERDNTLNQLLVEMDGFGTETNVIVMGATNRKELLDPALTRPGRFDRIIEITLPDIEGRKQIFMIHLKPLKLSPERTMEEYAKRLATLTPGFSGADIANLCNEAAILAARRNKKFVTPQEFEDAAERVMAGLEKKKLVSDEEKKIVAIHESGHAVVSWFLEGGAPLLKLTIVPRSKGSLGFAQYLPNESSLETRDELLDRICCILGGRCSEELFNGKVTTGAYDDLRKAYDLAEAMVTKFGMSEKVGLVGFEEHEYVKKYSDYMSKEIDDEIKRLIDECTERTRLLVRTHKDKIEKLSQALLEKETLDLNGIIEVLGERPFPPKTNFKAYLEQKKQLDQEIEELKEKEKQEEKEEKQEAKEEGQDNKPKEEKEEKKEEQNNQQSQ